MKSIGLIEVTNSTSADLHMMSRQSTAAVTPETSISPIDFIRIYLKLEFWKYFFYVSVWSWDYVNCYEFAKT